MLCMLKLQEHLEHLGHKVHKDLQVMTELMVQQEQQVHKVQ